jgi:hypothetical protein
MRPKRFNTLFFTPKTAFLWAKTAIIPSRSKKNDPINWHINKPDVLSNGQRKTLARNRKPRPIDKIPRSQSLFLSLPNRQTPLGRPTRAVVFLNPHNPPTHPQSTPQKPR